MGRIHFCWEITLGKKRSKCHDIAWTNLCNIIKFIPFFPDFLLINRVTWLFDPEVKFPPAHFKYIQWVSGQMVANTFVNMVILSQFEHVESLNSHPRIWHGVYRHVFLRNANLHTA